MLKTTEGPGKMRRNPGLIAAFGISVLLLSGTAPLQAATPPWLQTLRNAPHCRFLEAYVARLHRCMVLPKIPKDSPINQPPIQPAHQ
jgi:hypothetical protein